MILLRAEFPTMSKIIDRDFFSAFIFVTCIKLLFIPMYHSTDMEVHRNWKAITHNLEFYEWYYEDTSPWTLDYPPGFGMFEFVLSHAARCVDSKLLDIGNLNYKSPEAIFFMRISVIISDLVYVYAVGKIFRMLKRKVVGDSDPRDPWFKHEVIFAMLMLWNPGLLLVDHIHFQYNGFLNGILFLSIAAVMDGNYLDGAFWYTILLNLKHLYIYFAPAYFLYLFKHYCFIQRRFIRCDYIWENFSFKRLFSLGAVVSTIFAFSFGPFIAMGQFTQVLKRIFPVQRGLTHAYWAPNFWALYNFLDRVLAGAFNTILGWKRYAPSSVTKGLVQQYDHAILPSVSVEVTIILTLLSVIPFMWLVLQRPRNFSVFIHAIIGCAFGSFLFGYHVHEKAVLMITLPLTLSTICHKEFVPTFVLASTAGHFALFPLLHESGETPIKIVILLLHFTYSYTSLRHLKQPYYETTTNAVPYSAIEVLLLCGIPVVLLLNSFGLVVLQLNVKYQFLPLMNVSVYCALCILYCWIKYCKLVFNLEVEFE